MKDVLETTAGPHTPFSPLTAHTHPLGSQGFSRRFTGFVVTAAQPHPTCMLLARYQFRTIKGPVYTIANPNKPDVF